MTTLDTRMIATAAALTLAVAMAGQVSAAQTVADVPSPRGAKTRILVETADDAWVTMALFAGGNGGMQISDAGEIANLKGNFLIRARRHFRGHGANTAVIDAPSDRHDLSDFRHTEGHADDIGAVVRHLKATLKRPVWLVGTSNGTVSVANAAARLTGETRPDGVVLTSTRFETTGGGVSVLKLGPEKITGPVLIAHHRSDSCYVTLPSGVADLAKALTKATPVKVLWYEGGKGVRGDPCQARHYHGFVGIEKKVIADIMGWVRNPAP